MDNERPHQSSARDEPEDNITFPDNFYWTQDWCKRLLRLCPCSSPFLFAPANSRYSRKKYAKSRRLNQKGARRIMVSWHFINRDLITIINQAHKGEKSPSCWYKKDSRKGKNDRITFMEHSFIISLQNS